MRVYVICIYTSPPLLLLPSTPYCLRVELYPRFAQEKPYYPPRRRMCFCRVPIYTYRLNAVFTFFRSSSIYSFAPPPAHIRIATIERHARTDGGSGRLAAARASLGKFIRAAPRGLRDAIESTAILSSAIVILTRLRTHYKSATQTRPNERPTFVISRERVYLHLQHSRIILCRR